MRVHANTVQVLGSLALFVSISLVRNFDSSKRDMLVSLIKPQPLPRWPQKVRQDNRMSALDCSQEDNVLTYIQKRVKQWDLETATNTGIYKSTSYLEQHGIWQKSLEDKLASYVFAKAMNVRVPTILACGEANQTLDDFVPESGGFVVKSTKGHSAQGVWVFPTGFDGTELLRGINITKKAMKKRLANKSHENIFIEEQISSGLPGGGPPMDYKVFVFNGKVAAVIIIAHRGNTKEGCTLQVDENFNFLNQTCVSKVSSKCRNFYCSFCGEFQKPKQWSGLIQTAKRMSKRIGVAMRIDFFIDLNGKIVLGEVTAGSMSGHFHCNGIIHDETGVVDGCWIGKLWREMSDPATMEGGPITSVPECLKGWYALTHKEKCHVVMSYGNAPYSAAHQLETA